MTLKKLQKIFGVTLEKSWSNFEETLKKLQTNFGKTFE